MARFSNAGAYAWMALLVVAILAAPPAFAQRSEQVREAQTLLNELGYEAGPADGAAGRRTRAAVRSYQRDEGLRRTGQVTPALVERLRESFEMLSGSATPNPAPQPPATAVRTAPARPAPVTPAAAAPRQRVQAAPAPAQRAVLGQAVAIRADALRSGPSRALRRQAPFRPGDRFDIYTRRGAWLELAPAGSQATGWARLGSVRLATTPVRAGSSTAAPARQRTSSSGGGFTGLSRNVSSWVGGGSRARRGNQQTGTIGIRGLTSSDFRGSGPVNRSALAELDRYARPSSAQGFARSGGLQARRVPYPAARGNN